jgi:hypothetical protein
MIIIMILFTILGIMFLISGAVTIDHRTHRPVRAWALVIAASVACFMIAYMFQTHRIIPRNSVAVFKSTFTQELTEPRPAGIQGKPFFASTHTFPYNTQTEYCDKYTPSIQGGIGVWLEVCFYFDTTNVDWAKEVDTTGSYDASKIMGVWRDSVVSEIATSVKGQTPKNMNVNRANIEASMFESVYPVFNERGVPLTRLVFRDWDFSSDEVAKTYDESITAQARIAEQEALFEASELARKRELFEAETNTLVAQEQSRALDTIGLEGGDAVMWMWQRLYAEQQTVPEMVITNGGAPVAVSP